MRSVTGSFGRITGIVCKGQSPLLFARPILPCYEIQSHYAASFPPSTHGQKPLQVLAVLALLDRLDQARKARIVDIALAPGDLLGAADLQALAVLDRFDELRSAQQTRRRAGVKPGIAAPQSLDRETSLLQVMGIDVGDLELAARRARYVGGDVADVGIVEIESRHRPARARLLGFLDDADRPIAGVEYDHAVGRRIGHPV